MAIPTVDPLPEPPIRGTDTGAVFSAKTAAFLDALHDDFQPQLNEFAVDLVAAAAAAAPIGTSTDSLTIGAGAKIFTIEAGKTLIAGMSVRLAATSSPTTNYMDGLISAYNFETGAIEVIIGSGATVGSGTFSAWNIGLSGPQGAAGGSVDVQVFTTSGTWTAPGGTITAIYVEAWGAGGGGAGGTGGGGSQKGAAGGGGGGYKSRYFVAGDVTSPVTVTIGASGAGGAGGSGAAGSSGGNTTFGSLLTAYGGFGGPAGASIGGGLGGGSMASAEPAQSGATENNQSFGGGRNLNSGGAVGGASGFGGGAGASAPAAGTNNGFAGGGSVHGGGGGGSSGASGGEQTGGAGGSRGVLNGGGGAAGASRGPGGDGVKFGDGGGGAGRNGGTGGPADRKGGNGATAGGGGGGASGNEGGAGGTGGPGYCRVITWTVN